MTDWQIGRQTDPLIQTGLKDVMRDRWEDEGASDTHTHTHTHRGRVCVGGSIFTHSDVVAILSVVTAASHY